MSDICFLKESVLSVLLVSSIGVTVSDVFSSNVNNTDLATCNVTL